MGGSFDEVERSYQRLCPEWLLVSGGSEEWRRSVQPHKMPRHSVIQQRLSEAYEAAGECDFLLLAVGPSAFHAVIEQIGFASSFQETHGD
jgi:pyrroline-5-carboxylate reductase